MNRNKNKSSYMRGIELLRSAGSNNTPTPVQKVRIYLRNMRYFDPNDSCTYYNCIERSSLQEPTGQVLTPTLDNVKDMYYVEIDDNHYLMIEYSWDGVECPPCVETDFMYCHLDVYDAEDNIIIMDEVTEWKHETSFPTYLSQWGIEDTNSCIDWWCECSESDCEGRGKYDENYSGAPCSEESDPCGREPSDPDYGQPCEEETDDCGRTPDDPDYGQPCEEYDPCENLDECGRCEDDPDYGTPCDEEEEPEEEPEE